MKNHRVYLFGNIGNSWQSKLLGFWNMIEGKHGQLVEPREAILAKWEAIRDGYSDVRLIELRSVPVCVPPARRH